MTPTLGDQTGELVALAREGRLAAFVHRASHLPAADLADVLEELPALERCRLVLQLPPRLAAVALAAMARDAHPETTLQDAGTERAALLLTELEDDDAARLLGRLSARDRQPILALLTDRTALEQLLRHSSGTAGALMTSRLVAVSELDSIALATESVRRQAARIGDLTEILVVDTARRLCGVLSVKQLLLAAPDAVVRDVMVRHVVHVASGEEQELVGRVIARYSLNSVPVVDAGGRLLGRVTADDLRDVAIGEATEDLLSFGGVSAVAGLDTGWWAGVRSRLPLLYANLVPAFGAAAVIFFFKGSLLRVAALAVWLPVVGGVGGNGGTQALAVAVRRLVMHPMRPDRLRAVVAREAMVGMVNGSALGIVVAGVAILLGESWKLGLAVLLAVIGNLVVAGIAGGAAPLLLKRVGRSPALASPIILTAVIDACGFALLLILASTIVR